MAHYWQSGAIAGHLKRHKLHFRRQEACFCRLATESQALRRGLVHTRLFRHMRSSVVTIQAA